MDSGRFRSDVPVRVIAQPRVIDVVVSSALKKSIPKIQRISLNFERALRVKVEIASASALTGALEVSQLCLHSLLHE